MPNTNIDYSKTVIYIIQHITKPELIYIGRTTDFKVRKCNHKNNSKVGTKKLYRLIRDNGGWDEFEMRPIKAVDCKSSIEARIEEEKCRVEYNANLNTLKAYQTPESKIEYDKKHKRENIEHYKEYKKNYTVANIDKIKKQNKEYYQQNVEHIKEYRDSRKDITKEYKKEYYVQNKEKVNEERLKQYTCSCGKTSMICNKARHEKTLFHQAYLNTQST